MKQGFGLNRLWVGFFVAVLLLSVVVPVVTVLLTPLWHRVDSTAWGYATMLVFIGVFFGVMSLIVSLTLFVADLCMTYHEMGKHASLWKNRCSVCGYDLAGFSVST